MNGTEEAELKLPPLEDEDRVTGEFLGRPCKGELAAIEESMQVWKEKLRLLESEGELPVLEQCALCKWSLGVLPISDHELSGDFPECKYCPLAVYTGYGNCEATPFQSIHRRVTVLTHGGSESKEKLALNIRELIELLEEVRVWRVEWWNIEETSHGTQ